MYPIILETSGWVLTDGDPETVDISLVFDPEDPYAVTVQLDGPTGGVVGSRSWVFARDLLADGLRSTTPVGQGRVQVQATSVLTEIRYEQPPAAPVVLRLPWWSTREFVRHAQEAVPRGTERCDVDSWVAALTDTREP